MWKEAIVTCLEVLCRYLSMETEGNYKTISQYRIRNSERLTKFRKQVESVATCANLLPVMFCRNMCIRDGRFYGGFDPPPEFMY
jgi:hypothetical protein